MYDLTINTDHLATDYATDLVVRAVTETGLSLTS
jgi:hypothetical protein